MDEEDYPLLKKNIDDQQDLRSLSKYTECMKVLRAALSSSTDEEFEEYKYPRLAWTVSSMEQKFYRIMKHVLYDYASKCFRQQQIFSNHERTFFVDRIVPIFNYFADHCVLVQFAWYVFKHVE